MVQSLLVDEFLGQAGMSWFDMMDLTATTAQGLIGTIQGRLGHVLRQSTNGAFQVNMITNTASNGRWLTPTNLNCYVPDNLYTKRVGVNRTPVYASDMITGQYFFSGDTLKLNDGFWQNAIWNNAGNLSTAITRWRTSEDYPDYYEGELRKALSTTDYYNTLQNYNAIQFLDTFWITDEGNSDLGRVPFPSVGSMHYVGAWSASVVTYGQPIMNSGRQSRVPVAPRWPKLLSYAQNANLASTYLRTKIQMRMGYQDIATSEILGRPFTRAIVDTDIVEPGKIKNPVVLRLDQFFS